MIDGCVDSGLIDGCVGNGGGGGGGGSGGSAKIEVCRWKD